MLWLWTFSAVSVSLLFYLRRDTPPIFGIYTQPGRWYYLKYVLFGIIFQLRRWRARHDKLDFNALEKPQVLSTDIKGFDAIFFVGANRDGYKMAFGCERRHNGLTHTVLYFSIPGQGLYHLPIVPDTCSYSSPMDKFESGGLCATPIIPMRSWKISYNGDLRTGCSIHRAKFEAEFASVFDAIDFNKDLSAHSIISSIATEPWTKEYFDALKTAHQNRYEQMGRILGKLTIDDKVYNIDLQGFRDHGFGHKRDWTLMHRYAYFILFLQNGYSMSVGIVCQPCTGTSLKFGYVVDPQGQLTSVHWCDFELYAHGENGIPPRDHAFQFKAGRKSYLVEISVENECVHYVGENWDGRMVERFVNCKVNGVSGGGVSEFNYRNKLGKCD